MRFVQAPWWDRVASTDLWPQNSSFAWCMGLACGSHRDAKRGVCQRERVMEKEAVKRKEGVEGEEEMRIGKKGWMETSCVRV